MCLVDDVIQRCKEEPGAVNQPRGRETGGSAITSVTSKSRGLRIVAHAAIGGQADIWQMSIHPILERRAGCIERKEIPTPMFVPRFELMLEARGRKRTNKQTRRRKPS
jgi:hypothetical protein